MIIVLRSLGPEVIEKLEANYVHERKVADRFSVLPLRVLRRDRRGKQEIPCVRVGRRFLYSLEKVHEYLMGPGRYRLADLERAIRAKPYVFNQDRSRAVVKEVEERLLGRRRESKSDAVPLNDLGVATQIIPCNQKSEIDAEQSS